MTNDGPLGERWNFDKENRKSFSKKSLSEIPEPLIFKNDARAVMARLEKHKIKTIGVADDNLLWPIDKTQSLQLLGHFVNLACRDLAYIKMR